ncbi:hypothetical protein SETIT_3G141500v2 [Setaria italica]|uniref:Uncharacterized protein n=1 Tax=Setaria italica TaxID=4555 RepID=K3ZDH7_SETIT|nr:uncharacterized protein LOC101758059 [Setaria italica]RCV16477.1 hypothetical protein SETIT_3G141500v2 [Setaria italica]
MPDSDHRRGVAAVARGLLEHPVAATATTTSASSSHDEEHEVEGFTFAAVARLPAGGAFPDGRVGPVYPVFGRPRSPPLREAEDPGTATALVPLGQLLLEERGAPSSGQSEDDDGGLDGVPAETYCLWSPGASPAPGSQSPSSPARCRKSGSTGSVLRWRQRVVRRSHSDGKEKFVFMDASSESERNAGRKSTFLPCKQDLVGFFANAGAFRRSYLPF